jgi:hypothetical protein
MIIRNTSRYPDAEVEALVEFAAIGLPVSRVCVNVKGSEYAYAGRAYQYIPRQSNAPRSCKYLVVLRIGPEKLFPIDNMRSRVRWVRVKSGEAYDVREVRSVVRGTEHWLERQVISRGPYGGGPLIKMEDWREGLVSLAAHEFRHIKQFREGLVLSEKACETHAAERLAAWRWGLSPSAQEDCRT